MERNTVSSNRRLFGVKMSTLLQLIDKFNTFPIKSPSKIFCRYKQDYSKMYMGNKGIITAKTILIKKEEGKSERNQSTLFQDLLHGPSKRLWGTGEKTGKQTTGTEWRSQYRLKPHILTKGKKNFLETQIILYFVFSNLNMRASFFLSIHMEKGNRKIQRAKFQKLSFI